MIDKETQKLLFDEFGTPEHVRRHCVAVAAVAVRIGSALNDAGCKLDLELIEGAARVHDIARTEKNHAFVGAEFLIKRGYPYEAILVRSHMNHPFGNVKDIREQDVLCLADRVVREDEYVGIEKRVEYLMAKPAMTAEGKAIMQAVMEATKQYIRDIEDIIGVSLDELIQKEKEC